MTGVRHALALSGGGSAALWIALLSLGVGAGDEGIVPGFTFVASISSVVYTGATPVLAEVDDTFDLDPADVEARITPRTKAIIVVHMLGAPARLDELKAVADRHADVPANLGLVARRIGLRAHVLSLRAPGQGAPSASVKNATSKPLACKPNSKLK